MRSGIFHRTIFQESFICWEENPATCQREDGLICNPGLEDVVFLNLNFNGQSLAHIYVNWLDPHKIRRITIVGSKKMAVFDDIESTDKLKVYGKSAEHNSN